MPTRLKRRLIAAAVVIILIAVPSIWFARQYRQVKLNRALIAAIKESDASKVEELLAAGADPTTRDVPDRHMSLLRRIKQLLHTPSPDIYPPAITISLQQLTPSGSLVPTTQRIIKALIHRGADVNANTFGINAIEYLVNSPDSYRPARIEDKELLKILLDAGANIEQRYPSGVTPLTVAATFGLKDYARILIDRGANINPSQAYREYHTASPLSAAKSGGYTDIVKMLTAHGAKE